MRNIKKTSSPLWLVALLASAALLLGLVSQSALALTVSGTTISNLATLSYSVGGTAQTAIGSSAAGNTAGAGTATDFKVDLKVNPVVSGGALITLSPAVVSKYSAFTITNSGNARQNFGLVASNASAAIVGATVTDSGYDATPMTIIADDGVGVGGVACDGILNGTEGGAIATLVDMDPGTSKCVLVQADFTLANTNGQIAVITLKASTFWPTTLVAGQTPTDVAYPATVAGAAVTPALYPNGVDKATVDVVFADAAGVIVDAGATPAVTVDALSDGTASAYGAFKVASAALTVIKAVTVLCDPINGNTNPKNIPGAYVQYAITIKNAVGASAATLTQVTDALQVADLAFDGLLISGAGAVPATACSAAGTSLKGAGVGFGAVAGTFAAPGYTAPGALAQAVTAGAAFASPNVTITYATLAGAALAAAPASATLNADSSITVYFNVIVQ